MHTRFSTRDHQRVAYDIAGPLDGPAVVLLHDLLAQRSAMTPLRDRLNDHIRSIAIDLRGHGASATISGAAIDLRELAEDVAAVLSQEHIPTAVLVGHGLGAIVARLLAADQPTLARAIIAIEPPSTTLRLSPSGGCSVTSSDVATCGPSSVTSSDVAPSGSFSVRSSEVEISPPSTPHPSSPTDRTCPVDPDDPNPLAVRPFADTDRRAADFAYKGLLDQALAAYLDPRLGPSWRDVLPRPTIAALRRHAPALAALLPAASSPIPSNPSSVPISTIAASPDRFDLPAATVDAVVAALHSAAQ